MHWFVYVKKIFWELFTSVQFFHPLANGGLYIALHLQREGNTDKVIYRNSTIRPVSPCTAAPPCGQIVHFTWAASQEGIEKCQSSVYLVPGVEMICTSLLGFFCSSAELPVLHLCIFFENKKL